MTIVEQSSGCQILSAFGAESCCSLFRCSKLLRQFGRSLGPLTVGVDKYTFGL